MGFSHERHPGFSGTGQNAEPHSEPPAPAFAEFGVTTNFSFLRAASHPEELVAQAKELGLTAIGIADRNSVAGVVRAHVMAKEKGMRLAVGARLVFADGTPDILAYPSDRAAWGRLTQLLSCGKRRAEKGDCILHLADLIARIDGLNLIVMPPVRIEERKLSTLLSHLKQHAAKRSLWLAAAFLYRGDDRRRMAKLAHIAANNTIPLIATNDVLYHHPWRRMLQDVITCIREHVTIDQAGRLLTLNAERHLKPPQEMARLFAGYPDALTETQRLLDRCHFSLDEMQHDYPYETRGEYETPQARLVALTEAGVKRRFKNGIKPNVRRILDQELKVIGELGYAPFFLTVHDIIAYARSLPEPILCQGRGSAANSMICYCLGITEVSPDTIEPLFERFISRDRGEPPDIDVDFEHERREEVIQWIYARYGRHRAGLAATVIHWRHRMAIREVGRAMGLSEDITGRIADATWGPGREASLADQAAALGLDIADPRLAMTLSLAEELVGFPRHLSQHVGGFVITRGPLIELSPVANAAMADRTTIEWDKDDIERLGMLKVDVLALGMLSCVRKAFDLIAAHHGKRYDLATIPPEDQAVYAMLARADSVGVFQVESRAQMAMLPRLKPATFYDLVIQVAIVRPGPIQGDMVHPYLRRRNGEEPVSYPSAALEAVLGRTLGVPLFQEQAMKIAIVAAGFSAEDADRLRRAMATFRKVGIIGEFRDKMIAGMAERGYDRDFAERCFRQIEGFGTYGFPESHAASFALLVYVSAWIKCHYPAVFAAALLNSQPMGFYAPAQIVRDAQNHGVVVRGVDVNASRWDATLEPCGDSAGGLALRLGLREVKGLAGRDGLALEAARAAGNGRPFESVEELARRSGLGAAALARLAEADGFASLGLSRREALWQAHALEAPPPLFAAAEGDLFAEARPALPEATLGEEVVADYGALALSLKAHPLALLRRDLAALGAADTRMLAAAKPGARVRLAGLVLVRQRPGSAKGVVFVTLEDEFGQANLVVMPPVLARFRAAIIGSRLMLADGVVERQDYGAAPIIHLRAKRVEDRSDLLATLHARGADGALWDRALARADEVKTPQREARNPARGHPRDQAKLDPKRFLPGSRDFR